MSYHITPEPTVTHVKKKKNQVKWNYRKYIKTKIQLNFKMSVHNLFCFVLVISYGST